MNATNKISDDHYHFLFYYLNDICIHICNFLLSFIYYIILYIVNIRKIHFHTYKNGTFEFIILKKF